MIPSSIQIHFFIQVRKEFVNNELNVEVHNFWVYYYEHLAFMFSKNKARIIFLQENWNYITLNETLQSKTIRALYEPTIFTFSLTVVSKHMGQMLVQASAGTKLSSQKRHAHEQQEIGYFALQVPVIQ